MPSGYHGGHWPVRANGGGIPLRDEYVIVAEVLKVGGYTTALFGKWGLGESGTSGVPNKQGFDEFFGTLHQRYAQFQYTDYPWQNETHFPIPENRNGARKVYTHDLILGKALDVLQADHAAPYFCFVSITIPHHEWTAPESAVAHYRGQFFEVSLDMTSTKATSAFPRWHGGQAPSPRASRTTCPGTSPILSPRAPTSRAHGIRSRSISTVCPSEAFFSGSPRRRARFFYWEDDTGQRAGQLGGVWKIVQRSPVSAPELYDLSKEPGESRDVRQENPEMLARLYALLEASHTEVLQLLNLKVISEILTFRILDHP